MSEKVLKLEIVTPEKKVLSKDIESLIVPGVEGYLGILPNHAPLVAGLKVGAISYKEAGKTEQVAVSGGFLEVAKNQATILASTAEFAKDIDVERAKEAKHRAEERLKQKDNIDVHRAELALARALARLKVSGRS
ncbi:ATP synthase F1 subcomplex epsilon subunit [Desulfonispora thiosulfatigenes DSM 11270]|uniref:ATP synthase epsilon chain n=1 Tax=Desulfonispora thiosulfatigenes DSM 11270 TaxID=656914 RepID=A0A1W1V5H3_DESTI|nr:F0F1 ATP synthase subunit epsilon [Desulfonispora thiosulfatigenes]SMB88224.1 ATP synthase F1 subcomplex epsilon subunit [Desulfonispora thiosulfatigenes DSM 11270]